MPFRLPTRRAATLAATMLLFATPLARAADPFPSREIQIIVPFAAGGSIDFIARIVGQRMGETLGKNVVVLNRPGASGKIGVVQAKRSAPDGHTLLLATGLTHGMNPALMTDLDYDPAGDFASVSLFAENYINLYVRSEIPANTMPDFAAYIRANPGKLNFGTGGVGTAGQMLGAIFLAQLGARPDAAASVHFGGEAPAFAALVAGQLQFMFATGNPQFVKEGVLKVLATTGGARSSVFPDAPTTAEAGYGDVRYAGLYGLQAPAGTPPDVIAKLNAAASEALRNEALRKTARDAGFEIRGGPPEDFARALRDDAANWKRLVAKYHLMKN